MSRVGAVPELTGIRTTGRRRKAVIGEGRVLRPNAGVDDADNDIRRGLILSTEGRPDVSRAAESTLTSFVAARFERCTADRRRRR